MMHTYGGHVCGWEYALGITGMVPSPAGGSAPTSTVIVLTRCARPDVRR